MSESRTVWRPHVTVATVVARDGHYLMVEEDIRGELRYNQPAGHLEQDEDLAAAAVREAREETGWDVALDHFVGVYQWWSPVHGDYVVRFTFAGHVLAHHPEQPLDTGITRALWMRREEIAACGEQLRSPLVLTSIDDWHAGQRLPLSTLKSLLAPVASGA